MQLKVNLAAVPLDQVTDTFLRVSTHTPQALSIAGTACGSRAWTFGRPESEVIISTMVPPHLTNQAVIASDAYQSWQDRVAPTYMYQADACQRWHYNAQCDLLIVHYHKHVIESAVSCYPPKIDAYPLTGDLALTFAIKQDCGVKCYARYPAALVSVVPLANIAQQLGVASLADIAGLPHDDDDQPYPVCLDLPLLPAYQQALAYLSNAKHAYIRVYPLAKPTATNGNVLAVATFDRQLASTLGINGVTPQPAGA